MKPPRTRSDYMFSFDLLGHWDRRVRAEDGKRLPEIPSGVTKNGDCLDVNDDGNA